jgi:hypothetical protein
MPRKDTAFAIAATALVVVALVLGFRRLGGRPRQRDLRADELRLNHLSGIGAAIHDGWVKGPRSEDNRLPVTLSDLRVQLGRTPTSDPITGEAYEYHQKTGSQYELCAVFATEQQPPAMEPRWAHPKGRHCFPLDAAEALQQQWNFRY